ncbi:ABC transporter ATP-binding protein [Candidatus Poribacteria bacterium]|nr:ABC transporter ATP-binding protein [Candidatus Poribacteria bacterium]MYA57471.1 ABC transporter ATP-binding protein [Candidatus Poribacteria bacterium]
MGNVKKTLKSWGSVVKDSIVAYIRTFSITWQNGALALLGVLLLTLLLGVVPAGQFFVTERLVNAITAAIGDADWWQQVVPWLIGLIGLQILSILVDHLREPLRLHVGANIEAWMNESIVRKSNTIELTEFQTPEFQNSLARARAMSGIELDEIVWWIFDSLQQLISAVALGIVLWRYHPLLALLPMVTGLASWWSGSRFAASAYNLDVEQTPQRRERDALEGILTDRGAGKEVRLYQAQDLWITRWRNLWTALIEEQQVIERRKFFAHLAIDIARGLLYACSLILLLLEVFRGGLTVGTYIAAAAALVQLDGIWNEVVSHFQWIGNEMLRLSGDLYPFLDRGSDTIKAKIGGEHLSEAHTNPFQAAEEPPYLRIENVSFLYPNTQVPVLNHINVTLKKGERVALVGPNGAGKTTLARVLLGLYRPQAGTIHVGDVSLNDENRQAWLTHCSAVFQDFTSYHLTARENIIFGDLEHPERMEEASIAGGAASVVDGLTEGYETTLGPTFGGRDLSGGEWQRLATARSFMRETPWLVVLDEPTAALDPLAEQAIYERFIERSAGRTSVLISHRLSSVRSCDRILVIDNGTIVEDGDHETLLANDGLYAQFFRAQAQWYL